MILGSINDGGADFPRDSGKKQGRRRRSNSPAGRQVAATLGTSARIWDVETRAVVRSLSGHEGRLSCVAWSPDGRWIATTGEWPGVRFWDAASGNEVRRLDAHAGTVGSAAFSRDGKQVVTTGQDGKVRLWGVR